MLSSTCPPAPSEVSSPAVRTGLPASFLWPLRAARQPQTPGGAKGNGAPLPPPACLGLR